jgi:hypothetical protein
MLLDCNNSDWPSRGVLFDALLYYILNTEICGECKRPINDHTANELFSCNLEKAKRQKPISDDEATESFNKIKSSEYARMKQKNKPTN